MRRYFYLQCLIIHHKEKEKVGLCFLGFTHYNVLFFVMLFYFQIPIDGSACPVTALLR